MHSSRRPASRAAHAGLQARRALTLVEMLVSLVCVILLMLAYTQLFSSVSTRIADARSMIELTNRMRGVANQLRTDLAGHTATMQPPRSPQFGEGYFEYVEGPLHDKTLENGMFVFDELGEKEPDGDSDDVEFVKQLGFLGDNDDVLMFTTRCQNGAFTGHYVDSTGTSRTVQSQVAEVVWFLRPTLLVDPSSGAASTVLTTPLTFTLYRRAYLVMPTYQGNSTSFNATTPSGVELLPTTDFYSKYDISAHCDTSGNYVANTLGDLTKRECRYGHNFIAAGTHGFPHRIDPKYLVPFGGTLSAGAYSIDRTNARYGEDVVLTNVVSFDVQAWDPTAPVYNNSGVAVSPSDPGFPYRQGDPSSTDGSIRTRSLANITTAPSSLGAFVDLNWLNPVTGTPSNANPTTLWNGSPLFAPWNPSILISPFFCQGHVKSQLTASEPSSGPTSPIDFETNWLFDDHVNGNGLPDYGTFNHTPATYDTWSTHYEHDGLDQDAVLGDTLGADQGAGPGSNPPETSPPYPVPLRGIKITLRCYEPDSRQMHEISVVESFVPE